MLEFIFFFNDTRPTEIYTLSLHDALPIFDEAGLPQDAQMLRDGRLADEELLDQAAHRPFRDPQQVQDPPAVGDRKSTRLNSSHMSISYAVFCLKKKKNTMWRDLEAASQYV